MYPQCIFRTGLCIIVVSSGNSNEREKRCRRTVVTHVMCLRIGGEFSSCMLKERSAGLLALEETVQLLLAFVVSKAANTAALAFESNQVLFAVDREYRRREAL